MTIDSELGLHVRPAAEFVIAAKKFKCRIWIERKAKRVNGKSILDVLTLADVPGNRLAIVARGKGARQAVETLAAIAREQFGRK